MSAVLPAAGAKASWFGPRERAILLDPLLMNNPIGVQVLGICSCLLYTSISKALRTASMAASPSMGPRSSIDSWPLQKGHMP